MNPRGIRERQFRVVSHRRSGEKLLRDLMRVHPGLGATRAGAPRIVRCTHESWTPERATGLKRARAIYCVRDARDVLVANYCALNGQPEKPDGFGRFLRGLTPRRGAPIDDQRFARACFEDPIRYWINHTTWADHLFTVRYEDVVAEPAVYMDRLAAYMGLDASGDEPARDSPIGEVAQWQSWFSTSDHDYFWSLAGERMRQLGYRMSESGAGRHADRVEVSQICFINLDRREDRAQRLRESLFNAGVADCVRIVAVDGQQYGSVDEILESAGMRMNDHFARTRADYTPLDPRFRAKAGCWVSHYKAIADIPAGDGWTVILEDDVRVDFSREVLISRLSATVSDRPEVDMVVLGQRLGIANEGHHLLERGRRGTDAYAVRNASARKIVALLRTEVDELKVFSLDGRFAELDRSGRLYITSLSGGPWATCLDIGRERDSDIDTPAGRPC